MSITLYYAPGACSLASHIALEEVGVPYETQRLNLFADEQRKPEYLKLNPRGRGYPQAGLWPKKTWDQAKLVASMAWLSNTAHTTAAHFFRPERYADHSAAQAAVEAKARILYANYLEEIDRLLDGRQGCIADHYSVIDPYLLVFYRWGNRNQFAVRSLSYYSALVKRVLARPAVKKAMADEGITLD